MQLHQHRVLNLLQKVNQEASLSSLIKQVAAGEVNCWQKGIPFKV